MASKIMKLTAGGTLVVFGAGLYAVIKEGDRFNVTHPEAFAITTTASSGTMLVRQDTVSGNEIQIPHSPLPFGTDVSSK